MDAAEVVIGREAGPSLLAKISNAKNRLVIVSPWISPSCAELAVRKQQQGVDVSILTTNDPSKSHRLAIAALVSRATAEIKKPKPRLLAAGLLILLVGLYLVVSAQPLGAAPLAVGTVLALLGRGKRQHYMKPKVANLWISNEFVHAKVYVIDDEVAIGSTNFTRAALDGITNIEAVVYLRDKDAASEVLKELSEVRV